MARKPRIAVVAYNQVDGACAAAVALIKHPDAALEISSSSRIGETLAALADGKKLEEVHVCGLGVRCNQSDVADPAGRLRGRGTQVAWYCGRGYLEEQRPFFESISTPVFLRTGTNTEAVATHLGLAEDARARALTALARHDPHVDISPAATAEDQSFWLDLINAAMAHYFKYQDDSFYADTIRKLANGRIEESDRRAVEVYRKAGQRHVLAGRSDSMARLRKIIHSCAESDEPVLIAGESGVGKEYVAHLLHEGGARAMEAFVPVNCALFSGNSALANSELFGHVRGAFTGAADRRAGAFATADRGTLFLDELGELPPDVQAKLLRVLEDGQVTPLGADRPQHIVDVRVVAATNRALPQMVREGTFRADLYHRLDVLRVDVPPLREHIEDVREIVEHCVTHGKASPALTERDFRALEEYDWPGNVRQLLKVLKRADVLGLRVAEVLEEERRRGDLRPDAAGEASALPDRPDAIRPLRDIQREYALHALQLMGGNYTATARVLSIAPNTLRKYVQAAEG